MNRSTMEKRVQALEAQAGIGPRVVTWCGCPKHRPEAGPDDTLIITGVPTPTCAPLPWPNPPR